MSKKSFPLVLTIAAAFLLSGCTFPWQKATPAPSKTTGETSTTTVSAESETGRLKKFDNYDQLAQFMAANNDPEGPAGNEGTTSPEILGSAQAAGPDMADIVKTDGSYVYALVKNDLSIIETASGKPPVLASKIAFKARPQAIFVTGNSLVVYGSDSQIYSQDIYKSFRRQNPYVFFKVFDISDRSNPKQVRDLEFEGSYVDARLTGDYAYLITSSAGAYLSGEPLLPRVLDNGQVLPLKCESSAKCFQPEVYYFDIPYSSYRFANLTAVNIKDNGQDITGQVYILSKDQELNDSAKSVYFTYTRTADASSIEAQAAREVIFPKLSADDQNKILKIEAAPDYVLNGNEKKIKVAQTIDRYLDSLEAVDRDSRQSEIDAAVQQRLDEKQSLAEKTIIHKISFDGGKFVYQALGEVNGRLLSPTSLNEDGDYLRLATTHYSQSSTATDSYSSIYVLDSNLKPVGSLENLATSEPIASARFLGERIYLSTAKPTEPLYVIGLQDPAKPAVLGALKVPTYSTYLQPVNADGSKLFGLGRDTEDTQGSAKTGGLKLSLYDFSDLSKPKELDSYIIGDSSSDSIALTDHTTFQYFPEKNLLVFPGILREKEKLSFAGLFAFSVKSDHLEFLGKVDHSDGGHYGQLDSWNGFDYYDNTARRSLYVGDSLYSFSNRYLKINAISDLAETGKLGLTSGGDDYIITTPPSETMASSTPQADETLANPEPEKVPEAEGAPIIP